MNIQRIKAELEILRLGYDITVSNGYDWIVFSNFILPEGYNYLSIPVAIKLGLDYPLTPTIFNYGGYGVYTKGDLLFNGIRPNNYFSAERGWHYWCFRTLEWDPYRDNINTILELFRITLIHWKKI